MRQKIRPLRLEVVEQHRSVCTTTSIVVPAELPSVEEALGMLAGALKDLVQFPLFMIFLCTEFCDDCDVV